MNYYKNYYEDDDHLNIYIPDYDEEDDTTFQLDEDGNMYDLHGNFIKGCDKL